MGKRTSKSESTPVTTISINRLLRKVERTSTTGGTGATILRHSIKPIEQLIDGGDISSLEFEAAKDIVRAFHAMAKALMLPPQSWERLDRSYQTNEPPIIVEAVERYKAWANHWSMRYKRGDRTLPLLIAAVIDERGFRQIGIDEGIHHSKVKLAVIGGLRDYAARAGWCSGNEAQRWTVDAGSVFKLRPLMAFEVV